MWLQISNQPFTIGFFLYTFITDLPAGHLQFAMVNFGPLNQGLRALGFGPFMFSGPSLAIKEWSDKPFLRCFLKKKHEKHTDLEAITAIFGRSGTKSSEPNDGRWDPKRSRIICMSSRPPSHAQRREENIPKVGWISFTGEDTNHWSVGGFFVGLHRLEILQQGPPVENIPC